MYFEHNQSFIVQLSFLQATSPLSLNCDYTTNITKPETTGKGS